MHKSAIASHKVMKAKVPVTVARLKFGSFGRARRSRNCKAANLDR